VDISTADKISMRLREHAGNKTLVVGVSGGVDSAVTLALCVRAVGKQRVLTLILPHSESTPPEDLFDARSLVSAMGTKYREHSIDDITNAFQRTLGTGDHRLIGNIKARIRMAILYYYANLIDGLVVGTGDRSELMLGYFTKYGDGGVDLLPLGSLYKTQVRELALLLNLPQRIAVKPSSPALWKGQTAQAELGAEYDVIDRVLYGLTELGLNRQQLEAMGFSEQVLSKIMALMENSSHKRSTPPILF
jgi:NAD+ synthase